MSYSFSSRATRCSSATFASAVASIDENRFIVLMMNRHSSIATIVGVAMIVTRDTVSPRLPLEKDNKNGPPKAELKEIRNTVPRPTVQMTILNAGARAPLRPARVNATADEGSGFEKRSTCDASKHR